MLYLLQLGGVPWGPVKVGWTRATTAHKRKAGAARMLGVAAAAVKLLHTAEGGEAEERALLRACGRRLSLPNLRSTVGGCATEWVAPTEQARAALAEVGCVLAPVVVPAYGALLPTLLLARNGKVRGRLNGWTPAEARALHLCHSLRGLAAAGDAPSWLLPLLASPRVSPFGVPTRPPREKAQAVRATRAMHAADAVAKAARARLQACKAPLQFVSGPHVQGSQITTVTFTPTQLLAWVKLWEVHG